VLSYLGRLDRQVKVSGVRIELTEIEAVLSTHAAVAECAVLLSERTGRSMHSSSRAGKRPRWMTCCGTPGLGCPRPQCGQLAFA